MTTQHPIETYHEEWRRDRAIIDEFLYQLRCGKKPELINDDVIGWELFVDGHGYYPLKDCEEIVNKIIEELAFHYQRLSAALGDPNLQHNHLAFKTMRDHVRPATGA